MLENNSYISQTEQPPVFNSGHKSGGKNTNLANMFNAIYCNEYALLMNMLCLG